MIEEKDGGGTMVNPGGGGPHEWGVIVNTVGMGALGTNAGGMNARGRKGRGWKGRGWNGGGVK